MPEKDSSHFLELRVSRGSEVDAPRSSVVKRLMDVTFGLLLLVISLPIMLEEGVPMRVVAEQMGHSSTRITEDTYSQVTRPLVDDAGAAVERAAPPPQLVPTTSPRNLQSSALSVNVRPLIGQLANQTGHASGRVWARRDPRF